jgi:hypothetical protein
VQRYQCKVCRHTFNAQVGSLFYRKHARAKDIIEVVMLAAEGLGVRATARVKQVKKETVQRWRREAAQHGELVSEVLLQGYPLTGSQIDALWTFVGCKRGKKGALRAGSMPAVR